MTDEAGQHLLFDRYELEPAWRQDWTNEQTQEAAWCAIDQLRERSGEIYRVIRKFRPDDTDCLARALEKHYSSEIQRRVAACEEWLGDYADAVEVCVESGVRVVDWRQVASVVGEVRRVIG